MTNYILAQPNTFDLSATFTIYDNWQQSIRRTFPLRNLQGETASEQVESAKIIIDNVAQELHYLTGYGIDKSVLKLNGKKEVENIYEQYRPHEQSRYFKYGIKIKFSSVNGYFWTQGYRKAHRITEERMLNESWKRECLPGSKAISFNIPCAVSYVRSPNENFFTYIDIIKHKRKVTGWLANYNRQDEIYLRFINRFLENGTLAIGEKRYWGTTSSYIQTRGIFWSPPKRKTPKASRRSKLASVPKDNTDYVYLIRMGRTKFYKIGKSNDPTSRLASMQTASPYKLKLLHTFKADNATAAEEELHTIFHNQRQQGEWFKLSDEQRGRLLKINEFKANLAIMDGRKMPLNQLFQQ